VNCFDYKRISYTGNKVYRCKEEGCPGDCQDAEEEVVCSIEMLCDIYIIGGPTCILSACIGPIPPYIPPSACPACMAGFTPEPVPPEFEPKEITEPSKVCK
jgi:hypothetical protein